jgi:hypothetical protein
MIPRVVISGRIDPEIVEFLSHSLAVVPNMNGETLSREDILRRAEDAQAVMVFPTDVIDEDFLHRCPHLVIVAGAFEGLGGVDVEACTRHGVWVTNVQGLIAESMGNPSLNQSCFAPEEMRRIAALEASANIFEALIGEYPKGAVNRPDRHLKPNEAIRPTAGSS